MEPIENFKTELEKIKNNYQHLRSESPLSLFNVAGNTEILTKLMKEVDEKFSDAVREDESRKDELTNISTTFLTEMSAYFIGSSDL